MTSQQGERPDNWLDSILLRYVNRPFDQAAAIECRDAIRAALSAADSRPAELDVERLARAIEDAWHGYEVHSADRRLDEKDEWYDSPRGMAAVILARLASTEADQAETPEHP